MAKSTKSNLEASPTTVAPYSPELGGRVLVLARQYFNMMLHGGKIYEVRHCCLSPGLWHVGHHGQIYGTLCIGKGFVVESEQRWQELQPQHRHPKATRPYKRTCALPVSSLQIFTSPIGYIHHGGSVGTVKFEPVPTVPVDDNEAMPLRQSDANDEMQPMCDSVTNGDELFFTQNLIATYM